MAVAIERPYAEQEQLRRLRGSRALATGLLAVSGAIFVATLLLPRPGTVLLLLRAVAEAALVGGLADWFAITALFRRPLGLPIPHTAILPAHKDRIGEGLARFLDTHFLSADLLLPELRELRVADHVAEWLAQRRNAAALAGEIGRALPHFLRAVDDRQIRAFLGRALGAQLRATRLAPLLGQLMQVLTAAGYHEAVLDSALDYAGDFLAGNEDRLIEAVADRRRRWMPRAINREIAKAMLRGAAELIEDLRKPEGVARQALLARIAEFGGEMSVSPGAAETDRPRQALFNQPAVRAWIGEAWNHCRDMLLRDLDAPSSHTQRALALMIASVGDTLKADVDMRTRLDDAVAAIVVEALPWRAELLRFIAEVVHRWEPRGFSDRIEAAVGADLQYIRMNGTIVGGLVGGLLYALSLLAR